MSLRMGGINQGMNYPEILPKAIHSAVHGIRNGSHRASCAVLYRLQVLTIVLSAYTMHHASRLRKTLKGRDPLRTTFNSGLQFLTAPIHAMFHPLQKIQHAAFKDLTKPLQHEFGK